MTNRYFRTFERLKEKSEGAFVPFVTLHDPDYERSLEIIRCLVDNGADALELGFAFSDPIADGPVIQKASIRALSAGANTERSFLLLQQIRREYPDIPIGLLLYSNLLIAKGIDQFYQRAAASGVDSVLIADVPIIESEPFIKSAIANSIQPIFIATPNADNETLAQVAELSGGYTYLLSRAGVTGTEVKAEMPIENIISSLKIFQAPPSLLGFGISSPEQVKQAIRLKADGAISGSAVVKIIEDNLQDQQVLLTQLSHFISKMKAATSIKN
ncbi:MAG: tryptophan synthase subunit alpha [Kangiellaceae bacterium]|nr:tryptophan synthase subunit alpha [Kangiellaceae bacterium]